MYVTKHISVRIGSVVMLGVFAGVFTANILCNLAHVIDEMGVEHSHPYGHDHHHSNSSAVVEHDHKDKGHDHKDDSGDTCCNNTVPVFFAALSNTIIPPIGVNISLSPTSLQIKSSYNWVYTNLIFQEADYLNKVPPLLIPDLRILLHSFLV